MNLEQVQKEWSWARALTKDLLLASSEEDLDFALCRSVGPLWKQFRHIGRVHENYLGAIAKGEMVFSTDDCGYTGGKSKKRLLEYYDKLAAEHDNIFLNCVDETMVRWPGEEPITVGLHLTRLLAHETLHHGQLILYWRELDRKFPVNWSDWGE